MTLDVCKRCPYHNDPMYRCEARIIYLPDGKKRVEVVSLRPHTFPDYCPARKKT